MQGNGSVGGGPEQEAFTVELKTWELGCIRSALGEYGGGSAHELRALSGHDIRYGDSLSGLVKAAVAQGTHHLTLTEEDWRIIYDSLNATIQALGPVELEAVTGHTPLEMLQTNLTIAATVWGAYGGAKWADFYQLERV